jgi:hypothetical protein
MIVKNIIFYSKIQDFFYSQLGKEGFNNIHLT